MRTGQLVQHAILNLYTSVCINDMLYTASVQLQNGLQMYYIHSISESLVVGLLRIHTCCCTQPQVLAVSVAC